MSLTDNMTVGAVILLVVAVFIFLGAYFWIIWIVAGIIMDYWHLTHYGWPLQLFILIVISAILGALGRIGGRK